MSFASRRSIASLMCVALTMQAGACIAQVTDPVPPAQEDAIDPAEPLAPMDDLGVDWPDPAAADETGGLEPSPPVASGGAAPSAPSTSMPAIDIDAEHRYAVEMEGLDEIESGRIRSRFEALSVLRQDEGQAANMAQIDRRAHEDQKLLRELLHAEGYYAAEVVTRIETRAERVRVILRVDPGLPYSFSSIEMPGLELAGDAASDIRDAFFLQVGDPVNATLVEAAVANMRQKIGDTGYPFAKVSEPQVTIDHLDRSARMIISFDPGGFARFGEIRLQGHAPFDAAHVALIARFRPGDVYRASDIEDLRRALIATGLVSSVSVTPVVSAANPELVDLVVGLERAPKRTIGAELGYGTGEGWRLAGSWTHRNLIRPEGAVTFRGVAGTREQYLGTSLRRSNFQRRDQTLTGQVALSHVKRDAYDARTFTLGAGIERQSSIIWQKKWTWSAGGELVTTDERDTIIATGEARRRTFYIAALPASLAYDGSDSLLDPRRGFRLSGRISPEVSFHGGSFTYARAQVDYSFYKPFGADFVLAGRTRIGTIAGARREQIAPSRRYYAGGGGSVRGYGYQDIGPRDVDNNPVGGRSIAEFSLEGRLRFGDFGGVAFVDAGNIYTSPLPRFTGMQFGAGLGVRYYSNFGPIRVDVGTPINRRPGDPRVAVYVSLGQAF